MVLRVCIFEDNRWIRESLSILIEGSQSLMISGSFSNADNVVEKVSSSNADVVLMDIEMPGINGIEAVKELRKVFPELVVIMQTVFDDDDKVFDAICAGASGYLLKDTQPAVLMKAIEEAHAGGAPMSPAIARKALLLFQTYMAPFSRAGKTDYQLTRREKEILTYLVEGNSYKQIAALCFISFDTVRTHIRNVYEKLHVASSSEAVAKAIKERLT
jgi:DNA-binding NarL/FixJ family response regulator